MAWVSRRKRDFMMFGSDCDVIWMSPMHRRHVDLESNFVIGSEHAKEAGKERERGYLYVRDPATSALGL